MSELLELLDNRINKTESCWLWTGSLFKQGYARLYFKGKRLKGHRVSYELYKGPIPNGLYICHKCNVKHCVNPQHLYAGTQANNMQDVLKAGNHGMKNRTHCPKGHEYNNINCRINKDGSRVCRVCDRQRKKSA
jgi:hypothetical protein